MIYRFLLFLLSFPLLFSQPYRMVGIGSAAVDLLIQVDKDFLEEQVSGAKGGSQHCALETIDRLIEKNNSIPKKVPGGSCANTIRGLSMLGEKCAFYTHVGNDPLGQCFVDNLMSYGIVPIIKSVPDYGTARILCMITPDGQRTIRVGFSPPPDDFFLNQSHLKDVQLVHFESYHLYCGDVVERAMKLAKEAGAKISLDLSSFETVMKFKDYLSDLIPRYVDILFANEDETRVFTGLSSREGCQKLQEICPLVIVTTGAKGCLVGHKGEILSVPGFTANVIDTTGAGDLFISGFLYGYIRGMPLAACARLGNRLGAAITEVIGTELSDWSEVYAFLKKVETSAEKF